MTYDMDEGWRLHPYMWKLETTNISFEEKNALLFCFVTFLLFI
jgi:hypothetical protein